MGLRSRGFWPLLLPILLFALVFVVLPLGIMLLFSFWSVADFQIVKAFTLDNYAEFFTTATYRLLMWKTLYISLMVAGSATVLAYPLALYVTRQKPRTRLLLFMLVLAPLLVDYLARVYAWRSILGEQGLINGILVALGILDQPSPALLFNTFAVVLTLLYVALPFTFIPIYINLEKIPPNLVQAAHDLGASEGVAFRTVTLPLSASGIATGFSLSFIVAFGDYVTPSLVGGTRGIMFGNAIQSQFGGSFNWPLGAALGVTMFLVILLFLGVINRLGAVQAIFEE